MMEGSNQHAKTLFVFACLAQKSGKHALAATAWCKYVTIRPEDPRGHYNHGVCLEASGDRLAAALAGFETAFQLDPTMGAAAANAAGLLIKEGEAERAIALCYRALKEDPTCSPALYNLNTALRMDGRQSEAVEFSWKWISARLPPRANRDGLDSLSAAAVVAVTAGAERSTRSPNSYIREKQLSETKIGERSKCSQSTFLTVACVRWGDKYGPEYVERLAAGVHRNLGTRHTFVCFCDDAEPLLGMDGVEARPLGEACRSWHGWWHKAFLFSREAGLSGRVLYIDLDTVIAGPLDEIGSFRGRFGVLSAAGMANEQRAIGINSSIMSWDAGCADENQDFHAMFLLLEEGYSVVTACVHKFDHWLEMIMANVTTLQAEFPDQIVEYAADCRRKRADTSAYVDARKSNTLDGSDPEAARPCEEPAVENESERQEKRRRCNMHKCTPEDVVFQYGYASSKLGSSNQSAAIENASLRQEGSLNGHTETSNCQVLNPRIVSQTVSQIVPPNARIICFPLEPKPHQVRDECIQRLWRGENACML